MPHLNMRDRSVVFHWHIAKGVALGAAIAVVSALQHLTAPSAFGLHAVYVRAYYVPIILAGLSYGWAGGIIVALVSVAACSLMTNGGPWGASPFIISKYAISEYAEFAVFLLIGGTVGTIARRGRTRGEDAGREESGGAGRSRRTPGVGSLDGDRAGAGVPLEYVRRADRVSALGSIAAGLAQEIQRPLTGLKNAVELGLSPPGGDAGERDVAVLARRELRHLETLVNRLIAYGRPCEPTLGDALLVNLLQRVSARLERHAERSNVALQVEADVELPPLVADPRQIEQVLFNVTLNALQASRRGNRVVVRLSRGDRAQMIEVIDEGPGIAREYQDRIFEPFFTTKERGVGLGLTIAQRIIDAHHGTIELKRRAPGGTIVRIELPEVPRGVRSGIAPCTPEFTGL